ncbi:MAG TPA: DapH/DapD/GlmU-related protein, partial [Burkholderiales bacterium]|nr:DapH/DapD/GlmU-related protein [Burkholderiales bacterium]
GKDVEIDVGCIFEGKISIGNNVKVGAYSILRDVYIGNDVKILPYTLIEESHIDDSCRIGPYARIRPGTKLGREVHIGDFVEIKNATIGNETKINHMSYVGDSEVGQRVNIGAGTITCNYDGANKNHTVIGDDVFIGSDSQLVAPVVVESGATIGAGSTITRTVAEGTLALSRVKQTSVSNWVRPQNNNKQE